MQEATMKDIKKPRRIEAEGSAGENVLAMYINEIIKIPLLTREEEDTTARKAASGDKAAVNKLVNSNLRFVVNVAKRYQGQGLPLSDLISEGNIGLMNAVERFDVDKGYHFISYAVWWIRQSILKAICEKSRMIRLPMNRAGELVRIERARKELRGTANCENEIREIADMLNMDETLVSDLINISREMVSLDVPVFEDSDAPLGEHIEDAVFQSPEDYAEQSVMHDDIESVLNTLDKKEADVIRCRFGIGVGAGMTLREVGDRFHLTKERIRQIELKALRRLKHPKRLKILENYVA